MSKSKDFYSSLIQGALRIIECPFSESESIELLKEKLASHFALPASESERKIARLIQIIVRKDEGSISEAEVTTLLQELNSEVTYSLLD